MVLNQKNDTDMSRQKNNNISQMKNTDQIWDRGDSKQNCFNKT